jgi:hypothetical protein
VAVPEVTRTTHVFNGLNFEAFEEGRNFASPIPRFRRRGHSLPVYPNDKHAREILVDPGRDILVVNVGNAVLAWKAGLIGKSGSVPLGQISCVQFCTMSLSSLPVYKL